MRLPDLRISASNTELEYPTSLYGTQPWIFVTATEHKLIHISNLSPIVVLSQLFSQAESLPAFTAVPQFPHL